MDNIVSALISATAAVIVALIGRTPSRTATRLEIRQLRPAGYRKWITAMAILAAWVILSPIAIHHDLPAANIVTLFIVTVIAGAVWPILGMQAAAWVLALHALNSVAEPVARMATGYEYNPFGGYDFQGIVIMTALGVVNAVAVGCLCRWRLGKVGRAKVAAAPLSSGQDGIHERATDGQGQVTDADFVQQLEKLSKLREAGAISDEEFRQAKKRILGEHT